MDSPVTTDGFTNLVNQGEVNENETTDDMDWAEIGQEEVQDQQNDDDKLDIFLIDILSCYWKSSNGKIMLRIAGFYGLGEETVKAENVKIDYPDTLDLYLIDTSIGVNKAQECRIFRVAK